MLDLVSVFCSRDLPMQLLQARSIARHFDRSGLRRVIYVWNDTSEAPNDLDGEVAACLDGMPYELILAKDLGITTSTVAVDGWTTQQAAKLLAARRVNADQYLVLDAKNHFIWPCAVNDFLAEDGRALAPIEHFGDNQSFRYALDYFDVRRDTLDMTGALNVTPFVFRTDLVRRLLIAVERRDGAVVKAFLAHQHKLTEFMSYQAYARLEGIDTERLFQPAREEIAETVWAATVQHGETFDRSMQRAMRGEPKVLALHWMACCLLSEAQRAQVCELWATRGLIDSVRHGESAIAGVSAALRDGDKRFFVKSIGMAPQSIACAVELRRQSIV